MEWKEAQDKAREFDFIVHATSGDRTWFNAIKQWDYTGQSFAIEVKPETNQFKFNKMHGIVLITTDWCSPFSDDIHFLKIQKAFMETIEKLK